MLPRTLAISAVVTTLVSVHSTSFADAPTASHGHSAAAPSAATGTASAPSAATTAAASASATASPPAAPAAAAVSPGSNQAAPAAPTNPSDAAPGTTQDVAAGHGAGHHGMGRGHGEHGHGAHCRGQQGDCQDKAHCSCGGPREGSKGISLGLPSGGGATVGLSYGLSSTASVRLDVGFDLSTNPIKSGSSVLHGFSIDAGYRMYAWQSGKLHAFLQPGVFVSKRAEDRSFGELFTLAAVGTVGAEYFFWPELSVSGATGLSVAVSNEFKDVRVRTGTSALYVNFYW